MQKLSVEFDYSALVDAVQEELTAAEAENHSPGDQHPSRINDRLFLGGWHDAIEVEKLKSLGITHVVNCASEISPESVPRYRVVPASFFYLHVTDVETQLAPALEFVREALSSNSAAKILVHCRYGVARSASLAIASLMQLEPKLSLEAAFRTVGECGAVSYHSLSLGCSFVAFDPLQLANGPILGPTRRSSLLSISISTSDHGRLN